jgi:hypothetical protein
VEVVAVVLVVLLLIQKHNLLPRQQMVADLVVVEVVLMHFLSKRVLMDLEHLDKGIMEELEILALRLQVGAVAVAVQRPLEQMLLDRQEELAGQVLLQVSLDLP